MKNHKSKQYNYFVPEKLYFYPESKICEGAKLLYPLIVALSKKLGYCYATNKYLGRFRNKSIGTISKFVSQLNNEGFIKVQIVNNGSGRHIFIVPLDQVKPLNSKQQERANIENIKNLSTGLQIKMRQNFINRNSTPLSESEYPPCRNQEGGLSKSEHHIINRYKEKKIISKSNFYKFVREHEVKGNRIYCDVNYFFNLMTNHNWRIESEQDPEDWKSYFIKFNNLYKNLDKEKYSNFQTRQSHTH